ncbi:hypothetical protein [Streptomyces chrestomyceticus]|uniref:hypothetical protein n=1 Tax=Streptomyces chrestomyceticus TaxID=68185 RepID=UPI000ACB0A5D
MIDELPLSVVLLAGGVMSGEPFAIALVASMLVGWGALIFLVVWLLGRRWRDRG